MIKIIKKIILKSSDMPLYGANIIIKQYAKFPNYLPLPCHIEHGWTPLSNPISSDLSTTKNTMLVYSSRRVKSWNKESNIPAAVIGAPFIHYRRMHNIIKNNNAKGTIVFPSHSTNEASSEYNIKKYCQALQDLPVIFKPIRICLHFIDIEKGRAKAFNQAGFEVTSAGSKHNLSFVRNTYNILKEHQFAISNEIGSYTFYCVEMGLPFFLLGEIPILENKGNDPNIPDISKITDYPIGKDATKLFTTGPITKITNEQRAFVEKEIGINDCLEPQELNSLLWKIYKQNKYLYSTIPLFWIINVYRKIKKII